MEQVFRPFFGYSQIKTHNLTYENVTPLVRMLKYSFYTKIKNGTDTSFVTGLAYVSLGLSIILLKFST